MHKNLLVFFAPVTQQWDGLVIFCSSSYLLIDIKIPHQEILTEVIYIMKGKIISLLKENGGYMSGEKISEELGITRSAVWKHINSLKEDGYEIDSVRNKGYMLTAEPDHLDEEKIRSKLDVSAIGKRLVILKTVDSTNEEAKRLARSGGQHGLIVTSDSQTNGKGRFSRKWSSGPDGGLYFSILLKPDLPPSDIASITLSAGYAVCLAVREYTGLEAAIKWPNDIILGSKKLCGILTEMAAQSDRIDYVIIGIGINVNNQSFPEEIAHKAISMRMALGRPIDRSDFFACVINKLDRVIGDFLISLSIDDIAHFKTLCATMNRTVTIVRAGQEITGTACDVSPGGELIVRLEGGKEITVTSGEVTVQGIY